MSLRTERSEAIAGVSTFLQPMIYLFVPRILHTHVCKIRWTPIGVSQRNQTINWHLLSAMS